MTPPVPARRAGLSLLEVLLALALTALIVVAAGGALTGVRDAAGAAGTASEEVAALDLGRELLAAQLRRSGYRPYPADGAPAPDPGEPGLIVLLDGTDDRADALRVRSVDDTLAGPAVLRDLRFEVGLDGRGVPQLYRSVAAGVRQPLVEGIAGLRIDGWVDARGAHARSELLASGAIEPWLLLVTLSAPSGRERQLVAPLPGRPRAGVEVGP